MTTSLTFLGLKPSLCLSPKQPYPFTYKPFKFNLRCSIAGESTISPSKDATDGLNSAVDSGLKDDLVLGDPNAPRFVLWNGKLRPVPSGLGDLPFFDLMSIGGKLRAGFGALGLRPPPPLHEESVEEFVRRNLGAEVFERLIEPFCSGVYAGNPAKLSMKAAFGKVWRLEQNGGSIIGGTFKAIQERKNAPKTPRDPRLPKPKGQTVGSFRKGLAMLPNAISARYRLLVKIHLLFHKSCDGPENHWYLQSKAVVMTIPSYVASSLLRPLSVAAADALSKFIYPPVGAVTISYPKSAIRPECLVDGELKGFGQLHPRSQGVETAPEGRVLLLNYIGGTTNTGIVSKTHDELVEAVDRDLRKMLINPNAKEPLAIGVRVWPQAIPQFLVGHLDLLETAKNSLSDNGFQGLFLGGNYVSGVALGRCVEGAYEVAAEVTDFLSKYAYK
ncbi:hypothetical protein ACFE04_018421 [Oxalis oulophora]